MKIVILDGYTLNPGDLSWEGFEALGELTVYDRTPAEAAVSRIGEAELVCTNKTPITAEALAACPNLRYVGVLATGYNVVDVQAARARGIVVTNIPTYGTAAVAQMTFALLLEVCHHVGAHDQAVRTGEWQRRGDFSFWDFPLIELADKTLGLIGLGRIGTQVGQIARAFGMAVLAYDPGCGQAPEGVELASLDMLLTRSDVISLHCPLLPETASIINSRTIAGMKDGVILINTARGPLLAEADVARALESGKIGYAAVDVVSEEPVRPDNPLLSAPRCLITPHIAWAPREARARLMRIAVENLKAFLEGSPVHAVG